MSLVRVKKAELKGSRISITLEEGGREFTFTGDAWEVLWDIKKILRHWKETVIPRRLELGRMSKEELERRVKGLEGMTED